MKKLNMKKLILLIGIFICLCGCTSNTRVRHWGGTLTVNLPAGQELMEATWKDNNLYYLTRPMADDYVPVVKTFHENSHYGVMEGTVIFIETR